LVINLFPLDVFAEKILLHCGWGPPKYIEIEDYYFLIDIQEGYVKNGSTGENYSKVQIKENVIIFFDENVRTEKKDIHEEMPGLSAEKYALCEEQGWLPSFCLLRTKKRVSFIRKFFIKRNTAEFNYHDLYTTTKYPFGGRGSGTCKKKTKLF